MADSTDTNQAPTSAASVGTPLTPPEPPKTDDVDASPLLRPGADAPKNDEPIVAPPVEPAVLPPSDAAPAEPVNPPPAPTSAAESFTPSSSDVPPIIPPPSEPPPAEPPPPIPAPPAPSKPEETLAPAVAAAAAGMLSTDDTGGSQGTTPPPEPAKPEKKKGKAKTILLGLIALFFLVSTGLIFVIVNQRQQIADMRGKATYTGFQCNKNDPNACNGHPEDCHCQGGDLCTGTLCETNIRTSCLNQGRSWCTNWQGQAMTCCVAGYTCCQNVNGCCQTGGGNTPTPTRPPGATETPTPTRPPGATDTPTHTPTNTPTNTPSGTPSHTPTGTPSNTPSGTPSNTPTYTPTPTKPPGATDTPTYTPTPTQIVYATCNQACTVNADCGQGLVCLDSVCRNPSCSESSTCQCGGSVAVQPTPKIPVAGTGPTVLGASIIGGGVLLLILGLLF